MGYAPGESGNPGGKPKSEYRRMLDQYIAAKTKQKKKSVVQHIVDRAYEDDTVLVALLRKILPDLKAVDVRTTQVAPFKLLIDVSPSPSAQLPKRKKIKKIKSRAHDTNTEASA
jgi:hypothetical protein